jgi:hypothetical protein
MFGQCMLTVPNVLVRAGKGLLRPDTKGLDAMMLLAVLSFASCPLSELAVV